MTTKLLRCLSGQLKHSYVSNHEGSPSSAHAAVLAQLSVHVPKRLMQPCKHSRKWDGRKTECAFHQGRARTMLSACTKCLFTQILKTPLPLVTQDPAGIALQTAAAWKHLVSGTGRWRALGAWMSDTPQACTDSSGSHHGRGECMW